MAGAIALDGLLDRWERRTLWFERVRLQFLEEFSDETMALAPVAVTATLLVAFADEVDSLTQMVDGLTVEIGTLSIGHPSASGGQ